MIKAMYRESGSVALNERQAHTVFLQVLDQLREDHFIRNEGTGEPILYHTIDMHGHGSDVDERILEKNIGTDKYQRLIQVCRTYNLFKDSCFTFRDHQYHQGKCRDCGKTKS